MGCGSGYVITSAVRIVAAGNGRACQFIATDISEAALAATRATLNAHKVHSADDLPKHTCVAAMSIANACWIGRTRCRVHVGQVQDAVEVIAADLLRPLLPRLRRSIDLLVGTGLPRLLKTLIYDV